MRQHPALYPPDPDPARTDQLDTLRVLAGLMADLSDSVNGLTLRGARAVPVGTSPQGTLRPLASGAAGRLVGWTLRESSGVGSVMVRLFDGHDANGIELACIPLASMAEAPSSAAWSSQSLPGGGVSITDGLYISVTDPVNPANPAAGTVAGTVWIGAAE